MSQPDIFQGGRVTTLSIYRHQLIAGSTIDIKFWDIATRKVVFRYAYLESGRCICFICVTFKYAETPTAMDVSSNKCFEQVPLIYEFYKSGTQALDKESWDSKLTNVRNWSVWRWVRFSSSVKQMSFQTNHTRLPIRKILSLIPFVVSGNSAKGPILVKARWCPFSKQCQETQTKSKPCHFRAK